MEHCPEPSFQSQNLPLRPNEEYPYLGRDPMDHGCGIFTIVESMRELGLALKTSTLLRWLGRFEGFEMHVDEVSDPVLCVRQVLLKHVAEIRAEESKGRALPEIGELWRGIVAEVVELDFVHARSYWGTSLRPRLNWNPLEQNWMEFLGSGRPGEGPTTWQPSAGHPEFSKACAVALISGHF